MQRKMMMLLLPSSIVDLKEDAGLVGIENLVMEKLRELLHALRSFGGFLMEKLDEILPPETRSATLHHWLVVGLTVILPIVLSLLCLYYCCKCCCCGGRGGGRVIAGKMMKAPGRMGRMMPRKTFESDPAGYFRGLHANQDLLC